MWPILRLGRCATRENKIACIGLRAQAAFEPVVCVDHLHGLICANLAGRPEAGFAALEQTVAMNAPTFDVMGQLDGFHIACRAGCRRTTGEHQHC